MGMGNYRFRLSDMMPNAWFYKLKEMGSGSNKPRNHSNNNISKKKQRPISHPSSKATTKQQQPPPCPRKSYYFTRELIPTDTFLASSSPTNTKSNDHFAHHVDQPTPRRFSHSKQRPPAAARRRRSAVRSSSSAASPKVVTSSVSAGCSCRATLWAKSADSPPDYSPSNHPSSSSPSSDSSSSDPKLRSDCILSTESFDDMLTWSRAPCTCNLNSNDDVDNKSLVKQLDKKLDDQLELELPPIITKPPKFNDMVNHIKNKEQSNTDEPTKYRRSSVSVKVVKEQTITVKAATASSPLSTTTTTTARRRLSANSPGGVRLRIHSPKIASRQRMASRRSVSSSSNISSSSTTTSSGGSRRSLSESFAVVKSSFDPQRDFKESMVEMIMENNIRASKDLEDLLACYLSLNSDEYHDLIINVFKQIWFDLSH